MMCAEGIPMHFYWCVSSEFYLTIIVQKQKLPIDFIQMSVNIFVSVESGAYNIYHIWDT